MTNSTKVLSVIGVIGSIASISSILIYFSDKDITHFIFYVLLILSGLILGYFIRNLVLNYTQHTNKVFRTESDAKYNNEFYEYFNKKIKSAKHDIYITGEGFECKDEKGTKLARDFVNAQREALSNGVKIVRLQTKTFISEKWNDHLKSLLKEYPTNFELHVANSSENLSGLASICAIDDTSDKLNTVEFMFTVEKSIGKDIAGLASIAVFIENHKELCLDFKNKILNEVNDTSRTIQVTSDSVDEWLIEKTLYFSYGSNMDQDQMTKRCPSAKKVGIGKIENYGLSFPRKGSYRPGGVASIEPANNLDIYGVVFELSMDDFESLDRIEDPDAYIRKTMDVMVENETQLECEVYLAIPEGDVEPDKEYLELIINAARKENLPKTYVNYLKSFRKEEP